jgi:cytochrome c2
VISSEEIKCGRRREFGLLDSTFLKLTVASFALLFAFRSEAAAEEVASSSQPKTEVRPVYSALLNLNLNLADRLYAIPGDGGGIAVYKNGALIARRSDGVVMKFDDSTERLTETKIHLPPTNKAQITTLTSDEAKSYSWRHRYNDLEFANLGNEEYLVASYSYFNPEENCVTSRVSKTKLIDDWENAEVPTNAWELVFETRPCLPIKNKSGELLDSSQAGGALHAVSDGRLIFSVGDYGYDGLSGEPQLPHLADNEYGRIFQIVPGSWEVSELSRGHRNPQGITSDDNGNIWEVEHGPQGGDELNLIKAGKDYGWPVVSLGVNYTSADDTNKNWPFNSRQGRHDGFEEPVYAWLPSLGLSGAALIRDFDSRWDGDLLVSSLKGQSLSRLRFHNGGVRYEERIKLDWRIRDVAVGNGKIYILFDPGMFAYLVPQASTVAVIQTDTVTGSLGCNKCHSSGASPVITHILGKDIASQPNVSYSRGLSSIEGRWTFEKLKQFLTSPDDFAKGTSMPNPNLSAEQIDQVVDALR